ncbi:unnamed protein product [Amoebophrya sp. A120]|nr:unnamed protein product [Amoebophrya sp. A120]|eukprot:GSA120T00002376001.1
MVAGMAEGGHLGLSLERLAKRLAACERAVGTTLTGSNATSSGSGESIYTRVSELETRLARIKQKVPELTDFEEKWPDLEPLVFEERAQLDHLLLQKAAKREYVLQHAPMLREYAEILEGMQANSGDFDDTWQNLEDRIGFLTRQNEILVAEVADLSASIQDLAESYADVINKMSRNLLALSIGS